MNARQLIQIAAFTVSIVTAAGAVCVAGALAADRPNFVLIFADDLGVNDLSCYGRKDQPTPNLDRLASQGARFTTAYCAQPICSPSRAAIMTGKAPARLHITTFLPGRADAPSQKLLHPKIAMQLPLEEQTIAERLKAAGYATACIGKWHLGGAGFGPKEQGFDYVHTPKANTTPSATEGGKGEYEITAHAEKFIEDNKDRPFFLYVPHNTPHIPLAARPELIEKHKDAFNPICAAMMETLDDCVGRIMKKLDDLKLAKNTVLIFTSDNGGLHVLEFVNSPATHNTPYRGGKGFLYEGGLREPLIIRWPGKIKPAVIDTPVINTDIPPTLLALAGIDVPQGLDGVSIAPLLLGTGSLQPRKLMWHFPHYNNQGGRPSGAVRDGDWKLVELYDTGTLELYNLASDISEEHNLATQQPERADQLREDLARWRKEVGAQENTPNPNFDPALFKRLYIDFDPSRPPHAPTAAQMAEQMQSWRQLMNQVVNKRQK